MGLSIAVPILGPPAVGKTTLTLRVGAGPTRRVFRLREHVPVDVLAATASSPDRLGWLEDSVVEPTVRRYLERAAEDGNVHTILLDNFPGTDIQATMLIELLRELAPQCTLKPIELTLDERTRRHRARERRVCFSCEKDPISDPRIPVEGSVADRGNCPRCGNQLHPRRGDAPSLYAARSRRHSDATDAIRESFISAGYSVVTLEADGEPTVVARLFESALINRRQIA